MKGRRGRGRPPSWQILFYSVAVFVNQSLFVAEGYQYHYLHHHHHHYFHYYHRSVRPSTISLLPASPLSSSSVSDIETTTGTTTTTNVSFHHVFEKFVTFLEQQQVNIIHTIEQQIEHQSQCEFSYDPWGCYDTNNVDQKEKTNDDRRNSSSSSGGITRVLQGGAIIAKGACSLTVLRQRTLTAERAATISSRHHRNDHDDDGNDKNNKMKPSTMIIQAGDTYNAAALSIVLHSNHPYIPTFRSDVRIFWVLPSSSSSSSSPTETATTSQHDYNNQQGLLWLGGGADLTPYYLFESDVTYFHQCYYDLCHQYATRNNMKNDNNHDHNKNNYDDALQYKVMKEACDAYFYLPARNEHRGTGGIFFDDLLVDTENNFHPHRVEFCQDMVSNVWLQSWIPIIEQHCHDIYTDHEQHWMYVRRGRYLEFNLLYDRGVKFGLLQSNPRVEAVMVSAPPIIAYDYQYPIQSNSREDILLKVLKHPREWI
jgi:coproporphyrinogen III oxidase